MGKSKKLIFTPESMDFLEELYAFYQELHSSHTAQKIIAGVLDRAAQLPNFPHKGPIEPLLSHMRRPYRYLVEKHIKIIYTIEADTIFVVDFFDTRQDPAKLIKRH